MDARTLSAVFLLVTISCASCESFVATVSMEGVSGNVNLATTDGSDIVTVTLALTGMGTGYNKIEVKTFPVIFGRTKDAKTACADLGATKSEIFSSEITTGDETNTVQVTVTDFANRALVISSTSDNSKPIVCGNILNTITKTYRAKFVGPAAGEVWYRTTATSVFIYGDVYYTQSATDVTRSLKIYGQNVDNEDFNNRCKGLNNALSTAENSITIPGRTTSEGRFAINLSSLPEGAKSLAFEKPDGTIESCSDLVEVQTESSTTTFNWENVKGTIKMSQTSPFDSTSVIVDLSGLQSLASGYHIHKYPVPQRFSSEEQRCSNDLVSGHFNPYNVDVTASPAAGTGTNDKYEIGDLSGKFGNLAGETASSSYVDWNLPLFGVNSVMGRSIVIHKNDDTKSRWVCATIEPDYETTIALATFKFPAFGYIYLTQRKDSAESDTTVFGEFASQNMQESLDHNWHVHETMLNEDQLTESGRCTSAKGHYNPFGMVLNDDSNPYDCSSSYPYNCELGDSSGKLGTITVASKFRTNDAKFFSTDSFLPLSGAYSVMKRSIVVHDPNKGAPRYACANLLPLQPLVAETKDWQGGSGVSGSFIMKQETEFASTKASGSVNGLQSLAKDYHIHLKPIADGSKAADACQDASVGGHYDPFGIGSATLATGSSYDKYEVGDLSGKYGGMTGTEFTLSGKNDENLPLFTQYSSADRSIVIHAASDGSRWRCSDLYLKPAVSSGYVVTATVKFEKVISGNIKLRQVVYEDYSTGPTSISIDVSNNDGTQTSQHNWHIHIDPLNSEYDCAKAAGHYNPYKAPIDKDYYKTECNKNNPLMCELGDLSKKQEQYDIGGGRKVFMDVDVPLTSNYTVLGRSIVFHVKNSGADRYACANIIPDANVYTIKYPSSIPYSYSNFVSTVASNLSISESRVVVLANTDVPVNRDGCSSVMVYIVGATETMENIILNGLSNGGDFLTTNPCGPNTKGANVLGQKSSGSSVYKTSVAVWFSLVASIFHWFLTQKLL